MIRLILALIAAGAFLVKIDAQTPICSVGESGEADNGFCNEKDGDAKCATYCTKKFGAELITAACSAERPGTKKRECICTLKCVTGGCWGDPHCTTFDKVSFDYQGLQKYYVLKPCKPLPSLPEFEIIQSNRPYLATPQATLDILNLVVKEWGQLIEVKEPAGAPWHVLTVNRKPQTIPYRFSRFVKHREDFIDINFSDPQQLHLVIVTSFGLRITITNNNGAYSDLQVDIPRHPELRDNTCGILSRWNDNPADDNIDSKGQPQPLEPYPQFSWNFGNSWLVPGGKLPTQCEIDLAKLASDDHVKNFPKEEAARLRKMCKENLEQAELLSCLKDMGRPAHAIDDCFLDISHIKDEDDQKAFLKAMVTKFIHACPERKIQFKEPTNTCCLDNLVPLFRFYNQGVDEHFYTIYPEEVLAVYKGGWTYQGIEARVAINGGDCHCNPDGFKPVYRLVWANANRMDHFYTASLAEADEFVAKKAYGKEGQEFFCSTVQGESGATLPLYRYLRAGGIDHFYTVSLEQGNGIVAQGGKAEGILCYVWPRLPRGPENVSHKVYPPIN
jgi:hypothetical protein